MFWKNKSSTSNSANILVPNTTLNIQSRCGVQPLLSDGDLSSNWKGRFKLKTDSGVYNTPSVMPFSVNIGKMIKRLSGKDILNG